MRRVSEEQEITEGLVRLLALRIFRATADCVELSELPSTYPELDSRG
jgi:hypothetical protein